MHDVLASSSPSDSATLFWTALGVVAGLAAVVIAVISLWLTFSGRLKKQLLLYSQSPAASLLTAAPHSARQDLQVLYGGKPLADPRVVRIRLRTRFRKDILSDDFDQGKPIILDLGVGIVAKLAEDTGPGRLTLPPIEVKGTTIEIGPALLRKRQTITVTVLCGSRNPRLRLTVPLGDVKARAESYDYPKEQLRAAEAIAMGFRGSPPKDH
jgi:hypothetical protein